LDSITPREGLLIMQVDIVISIAIAAVLAFLIAQVARTIRVDATHKTFRKAIEQGQPLTPELIDRIEATPEPGAKDQRIGFVLVAAAIALICAGAIQGNLQDFRDLATAAIFPLFVGGALLLRLRLSRRSEIKP
jgi:peptidoglycan/LPS O-acetylase OafA/YrhL